MEKRLQSELSEALELKVEESMCFGAFDEFDRGILSAIERFYMLTQA